MTVLDIAANWVCAAPVQYELSHNPGATKYCFCLQRVHNLFCFQRVTGQQSYTLFKVSRCSLTARKAHCLYLVAGTVSSKEAYTVSVDTFTGGVHRRCGLCLVSVFNCGKESVYGVVMKLRIVSLLMLIYYSFVERGYVEFVISSHHYIRASKMNIKTIL